MPRHARAAARAETFFSELEENEQLTLKGPELLDGALRAVLESHKRLVDLLASLPPGTARATLLTRVQWSTERLVDQLAIARQAGISRAEGFPAMARAQLAQMPK